LWPRLASFAIAAVTVAALGAGLAGLSRITDPQQLTAILIRMSAGVPALLLGLLVAGRRPANPVSAFLCLAGASAIALGSMDAYLAAAARSGSTLPVSGHLVALTEGAWMMFFLPWAWILLVFPDGRLQDRFDRVLAWVLPAIVVAFNVLAAYAPDPPERAYPLTEPAFPQSEAAGMAAAALLPLFLAALIASAISPLRRYRKANDPEREQLRFLTLASAAVPATLLLGWFGYLLLGNEAIVITGIAFLYAALPAAIAAPILRRTLYDANRALIRSTSHVFMAVAVAAVVLAAASLAGNSEGNARTLVVAVATAGAVLLLLPVRGVVERRLGQWLFPARERALEAINGLLQRIHDGTSQPEDLASVLRRAVRDPGLRIGYRLPGEALYLDAEGMALQSSAGHARIELGGEAIGMVAPGAGQRAPGADVLAVIAHPAELARLRLQLASALREVEASRERLVRSNYVERRRLERDLHDGAQQRLVAIGMSLRLLQRHLGPGDAGVMTALEEAVSELGTAVAELRQLAHGIRPGSLDDGLEAALTHLTSLLPVPIVLELPPGAATGHGLPELSDAVTSTAYFVASEALANAVKHADGASIALRLARTSDCVSIRISDDGGGGAIAHHGGGLAGLADRVSAVGGALTVVSPAGQGTLVEAVLPCG
jgi:signal transduction histidine kinase